MTTYRGTCPACFREMDVKNGLMRKHGWTETGGRRTGEYGNAWHTGECFGVGWAPFEVSPDGTWALLSDRLFPYALDVEKRLARYQTRPVLRVEYDFDTGENNGWGRRMRVEKRNAKLSPGENLTVETGLPGSNGYCRTRDFNYERELERRVRSHERELRAVKEDGAKTYGAADGWVAKSLRVKEVKGPTVHFKREGGRTPCCGSRSRFVETSSDRADTTCTRCLKALDKSDARQATKKAEMVDAETLVTFLTANGPSPVKVLKKELGWDAKRLNRAKDREWQGANRVTEDYATKGPNKWTTKAYG